MTSTWYHAPFQTAFLKAVFFKTAIYLTPNLTAVLSLIAPSATAI